MDVEVRGDAVLVDGVALDALPGRGVPGGVEVAAPGGRVLVTAGPGRVPEAAPDARYAAVVLDLAFRPEQLGALRRSGAVGPDTQVVPLGGTLRAAELRRRTELWTSPPPGPHRTLLLGGVRSGKSAEAELRLAGEPEVTYVATGRGASEDPEWAARIHAHRERRPAWWTTVETLDLATVLTAARGAVLVDGLGGWLTGTLDAAGAWDDPAAAPATVLPRLDELLAAWRDTTARVVAVSDEVGLALVPTSASGRLFVDLLGRLNQQVAELSETVAVVAAGRVLDLP